MKTSGGGGNIVDQPLDGAHPSSETSVVCESLFIGIIGVASMFRPGRKGSLFHRSRNTGHDSQSVATSLLRSCIVSQLFAVAHFIDTQPEAAYLSPPSLATRPPILHFPPHLRCQL